MSDPMGTAELLRDLKDQVNEQQEELNELRRERSSLRGRLRDLMVDHRAALADLRGKQVKIDRLEAEVRR